MKTRRLATFVFEHETVLGDLLSLMMDYKALIQSFHPESDSWYLNITFADQADLEKFAEELGRNPIY
jgi:hypothetical protein